MCAGRGFELIRQLHVANSMHQVGCSRTSSDIGVARIFTAGGVRGWGNALYFTSKADDLF